jgi:predicted O-linked N-acetylglucosamine transferase (SPINDLY family)
MGRNEIALAFMMRAIQRDPRNATYFVNLGQVLEAKGDLDQAIANYRQAALLDPGLEPAHRRLGDALFKQDKLDSAAASYARALAIEPNSAGTINSLGRLMQKAGKLERSLVCYQKAISLKPDFAEAHNNLGTAYRELDRLDEGIESCRRALSCMPALAAAHCNLGGMLLARGLHDEAIESLRRAIALQPDLVDAHLHLGNALREQGLLSEAVLSYRQAVSLAPDRAGIYNNLAETFKDQGKLDEAVEAFRQALAAKSNFAQAFSNLLYLYAFTRHISPEAERALAEQWEKSVLSEEERAAARARASAASGVFVARPRQGRQLRLGIVSAELGAHAVADFLEPFLEALDRSRFHLTLFPTSKRTGPRAQRFRDLAASYIPLMGLSDAQAAERIRAEQIDILMDTTGHTFGGRLGILAHRAAPVQCTYIGYWSTTGLTEMDWYFGDPYTAASMDSHFTEGIWRLPRLCACYKGDPTLPESRWAPDPAGAVWLGSFNKYAKIREQTLVLWAKVLCAIPEAKLLLEDRAPCEDETHRRILTTLADRGVSRERVEFVPPISDHARHMVLYDRLDIALDTIPFNSGTTAFDALWMGVPLVALEGNWGGGRMTSSYLEAFGRLDWVAQNEDEYASIVRSLARNVELRKRLRGSQRAVMAASPLCNGRSLAAAIGAAFEAMYDRWMAGTPNKSDPPKSG